MGEVRIDIGVKGALFDGRAERELDIAIRHLVATVADQASADVHQNADTSFRDPTPYYETQLHRFEQGRQQLVGDRGVVYGPWLEGDGSRNRTTRFKGYRLWRRARQSAEKAVPRLARPILARFYSKANAS
jgi:hypothetical protein